MANIKMICTSQRSRKVIVDNTEVARFWYDGDIGAWNLKTDHTDISASFDKHQNQFYDINDAFDVLVHIIKGKPND